MLQTATGGMRGPEEEMWMPQKSHNDAEVSVHYWVREPKTVSGAVMFLEVDMGLIEVHTIQDLEGHKVCGIEVSFSNSTRVTVRAVADRNREATLEGV